MKYLLFISLLSVSFVESSIAGGNVTSNYTEDLNMASVPGFDLKAFEERRKKEEQEPFLIGGLKQPYQAFIDRTTVPGMITTNPLPEIATIVGPDIFNTGFRLLDRVFMRWTGVIAPKIGEKFNIYSPGVVLQNLDNPTDFMVRAPLTESETIPKEFRFAGYIYESTGLMRIDKVTQGVVEGVIEALSNRVSLGDKLMAVLPTYAKVPPIPGGFGLTAAVVAGSPADRISTTRGSTIYINRGSRDGVRVGHMFEAIESVKFDGLGTVGPEVPQGEAKVIYVTESFSTAVITAQFDVIRIGSLLRAKLNFGDKQSLSMGMPTKIVPAESKVLDLSKTKAAPDVTGLSELDRIEKSLPAKALNPEEKKRLETITRQQSIKEGNDKSGPENEESDNALNMGDDGTPGLPQVNNPFAKGQPKAKKEDPKKKKKKKSKNDEEELNLLMMQN